MKEEYIYCHQLWVESVLWRLMCQEKGVGIIRGLTVEEYEKLKPEMEKLTVDDFMVMKKPGLHIKGPSKEDIQKQIEELKQRFKELEEKPELLGQSMKDITFEDEEWWRPAKPTDRKPFFGREGIWGRLWDYSTGLAYVSHELGQPKSVVDDDRLMVQSVGLWAKTHQQLMKEHKMPKTMRVEVELTYPACDHYPINDAAEFVKENIQDWLNANLSDGDDRLKLRKVRVTCNGNTIEILQ